MVAFAAIAAFIGTQELSLIYVPIILPLMLALGFNSMTAAATALCATTAGFTGAITNPFTVGLAQKISIYFDLRRAGQKVCQAQQVADLKVLDLNDKPELLRACGALVCYLEQTQQCGISHLQPFSPLVPEQHLLLDEITIKNLEIFQRLDGGKGAEIGRAHV